MQRVEILMHFPFTCAQLHWDGVNASYALQFCEASKRSVIFPVKFAAKPVLLRFKNWEVRYIKRMETCYTASDGRSFPSFVSNNWSSWKVNGEYHRLDGPACGVGWNHTGWAHRTDGLFFFPCMGAWDVQKSSARWPALRKFLVPILSHE